MVTLWDNFMRFLQGMVESAEENKAHHKNPKQIVSHPAHGGP